MADGINYLQQLLALQAQEGSEGAGTAVAAAPPAPVATPRELGQSVQNLVDDLVRAARSDGRDGRLVDAVIEKFCNDEFALNAAKGDQVERLLKVAIHSAMQGGLTRGETLAAVSQVGSAVQSGGPVPAEILVQAAKVAGNEAHQASGIARLMTEMDGSNAPKPAVAATPDPGVRSDVTARYDQTLNGMVQKI